MFAPDDDRFSADFPGAGRLGSPVVPRADRVPYGLARLHLRLLRVLALMESDPDAAALIQDGLLADLAELASPAGRRPSSEPGDLLAAIEASDPLLALSLRLALRAPDVRARHIHLRSCLVRLQKALDDDRSDARAPRQRRPQAGSHP